MTRSEFEHLVPSLRQLMLQVALDFFGTHDDAEDATQEALMQLWHYCGQIDVKRNVEGLAVRITKNCCVNQYRQQQKATHPLSLPDEEKLDRSSAVQMPSPHELLEAQDVQATIIEVIAQLKPRERELFEMRRLDGLSNDEIAEQTGIKKTSVKVMVSTARKKVLDELKQRLKQ